MSANTLQPAETGTLPRFIDPSYGLSLAVVHLGFDHGMTDSRRVIEDLMTAANLPEDLASPHSTWRSGGHYGEMAKTPLVMDPTHTATYVEQRQAIHTGAALMTMFLVTDAVAAAPRDDRTRENTAGLLQGVGSAWLDGADPASHERGPVGQQHAFALARVVGKWLGLHDTPHSDTEGTPGDRLTHLMDRVEHATKKDELRELFDEWSRQWLDRMEEAGKETPDTNKLVASAANIGSVVMQMNAVLVLGSRRYFAKRHHPALELLGEIGGVAEDAARPAPGTPSYAAHLQQYGLRPGLQQTRTVRDKAMAERYEAAQELLPKGSHAAKVFKTVTWFAQKVSDLRMRRYRSAIENPPLQLDPRTMWFNHS